MIWTPQENMGLRKAIDNESRQYLNNKQNLSWLIKVLFTTSNKP